MRLKAVSGIMLTLLLTSVLTLAFNIQTVKAEPRTWTVDDDGPADFSSIQDAIDAASPGDTIFVKSGRYHEETPPGGIPPLDVTKPLTLLGENPATTFIDGWVLINAHNVCVDGFTIYVPLERLDDYFQGPVTAWWAANGTLRNNVIIGNGYYNVVVVGSWPSVIIGGSGWTISGNTILDYPASRDVLGAWTAGLWILGQGNTVIGNTLGNETVPAWFHFGPYMDETSDNIIYHNNFYLSEFANWGGGRPNTWDNGYPSGGNYWGDYTGQDSDGDGIGDTPYVIDENNQDNYPLMNPWTPENAIRKLIRDVENMNLQQGIDNSLDAKLTAVLGALEALNADQRNDAVNKLYALINEVEVQREKKLTNEQADYLIAATQEIISLID